MRSSEIVLREISSPDRSAFLDLNQPTARNLNENVEPKGVFATDANDDAAYLRWADDGGNNLD